MKLYVVFDNDEEVIAHTRDEELFREYCSSLKKIRNLHPKIVKDPKAIKSIEDKYYKQVIWYDDDLDEADTEKNKPLFEFAMEEYDKLQIMIKDLSDIIKNYSISKKDRKQLKESLSLLKQLRKKKNFKKAIGVDVVSDVSKNSRGLDLTRIFNVGNDK